MTETDVDLLIVGAGPAGLTAAQYGARANMRVIAVERFAAGGQASLIEALENFPGNFDPSEGGEAAARVRSGFDLMNDMRAQACAFGASFLDEDVTAIAHGGGGLFSATLSGGRRLTARSVVLATGASHRKLGVPGEEEFAGRGVSYCVTCDGAFFKNKRIFVVGGGDAACVGARQLSRLSPSVTVAHRRDRFRAQPALADRVLSDPGIEVRFDTVLSEIRGRGKVESVVLRRGDSATEESADAVFVLVGMVPRSELVSGAGGIRAELDGGGHVITDQRMATSVPGLFAAGDVRSGSFRQVVVAAGEGAVAAHSAAEYAESRGA